MTSMDNVLAPFEAISNNIDRLKQEMAAKSKDALEPFFTAVFSEFPELKLIIVQGFTPRFNDGDPCVHEQHAAFNKDSAEYFGIDESEFELLEGEEPQPQYKFSTGEKNPAWDVWYAKSNAHQEKRYGRLVKALESMQDPLNMAFGTNFELRITLVDGSAKVDYEDGFDCGH